MAYTDYNLVPDYSLAGGASSNNFNTLAPPQASDFNFGGSALGGGNAAAGGSFGFNLPTVGSALSGLSTIGNIWGAFQANKLAKAQFNFTKEVTNTNLNNQIKSYNTALEDRSRSRAATEGQSQDTAQAYVDQNRLSR